MHRHKTGPGEGVTQLCKARRMALMHGEEDRATHIRTDIISYVYMSILDAILSGA